MECEMRKEVEEAKAFQPRLSRLIIATTAPRDVKVQEIAREITSAHQSEGLFSVQVMFWGDIEDQLSQHLDVARAYYPQFSVQTGDALPRVFVATWRLMYKGPDPEETATIDSKGGYYVYDRRKFDLSIIVPYDERTRRIVWQKVYSHLWQRVPGGTRHHVEELSVENEDLITGHRQGDPLHTLRYERVR